MFSGLQFATSYVWIWVAELQPWIRDDQETDCVSDDAGTGTTLELVVDIFHIGPYSATNKVQFKILSINS